MVSLNQGAEARPNRIRQIVESFSGPENCFGYAYKKDEFEKAVRGLVEKYSLKQTVTAADLFSAARTGRDASGRDIAAPERPVKHTHEEVAFNIGVDRYYGSPERYVEKDRKQAAAYFLLAAERGHVRAAANIARCFMDGDGVAQNHREALYWFVKAAEAGNTAAIYFIADFCKTGYGVVDIDHTEAMRYYGVAAGADHPDSLYHLGDMLYNGGGVHRDEAAGYRLIKKAAELGFPAAVRALNDIKDPLGTDMTSEKLYRSGTAHYEKGEIAQAFDCFLHSAELGHIQAQHTVGMMHHSGEGTDKNDDLSTRWLEKSANQGNVAAQRDLGKILFHSEPKPCHLSPDLIVPDVEPTVEAANWFHRAALQGDAEAREYSEKYDLERWIREPGGLL